MRGRFFAALVLAAAALAASWTVSFASVPGGAPAGGLVQVASPADRPAMALYGGAVLAVPAGDLFIVDARGFSSDLPVSLRLVNAGELAGTFRYLTLKVGAWRLDDAGARVLTAPEDLLTLLDGGVSFVLPGGARYVLALDGGSVATFPLASGETPAVPAFAVATD